MPGRPPATTRDALFDAALARFEETGVQATSHADIAAEAGIGRTTFYEYFGSIEDLIVQLVETRLPDLVSDILTDVDDGLPPSARLAELATRMIAFVGTDPIGLVLHTEVARLSDHAQRRIQDSHADLSRAFRDVYGDGVAAGVFRELPGRLAGMLIYEVIMTAARELKASPDPKQRVHEVSDAATEFLLRGLHLG
ncbi:MAG TPA: TetR/AcrR family transcriptional regulator [Acidimicrobiia bacterium]|jgi:AcrR family transcriptional regulator